MISPLMSRFIRVLLVTTAAIGVAVAAGACGTERIALSKSNPLYGGAVLFNQRCSGCHTLSYAATHGSAQFVRTAEFNNGPNFNIRCERPMTRVLYAIENGGFSGAIMPQNVVVGKQAILVARFVATYAGQQAPKVPGVTPCTSLPVGNAPPPVTTSTPTTSTTSTSSTSTTAGTTSTSTSSAYGSTSTSTTASKSSHKSRHK